jgi:AGZA family xanthine/uracil permease-like MFS transporter
MGWVHNTNAKIAAGPVGRWFRLEGSGHVCLEVPPMLDASRQYQETNHSFLALEQRRERKGSYFFTEIRAGLAAFFAMAYIIAVNASIVADTGGTCVCNSTPDDPICMTNEDYAICSAEVKRDLVTATAAISALASFCMGLFANL